MGELVCLDEWRKAKEEEAHQEKLDEIDSLQAELRAYMDDLGEVEPEMYVAEEDEDAKVWHRRMIAMMMHTLDGYRHWPIDSSDM